MQIVLYTDSMIPAADEISSVDQKALRINLDERIFGTFAEIGAGQEVARNFFRVGGAAGTIAKTMSAYDMTFSDEIYGKAGRYVSKQRLLSMLKHEYVLLLERLSAKRGADTRFFVFANTVAARSFRGSGECHGWLGVRFQAEPLAPPSDVVIHVRMTDRENVLQQQALGAIGVNLLYASFFQRHDPNTFVAGLLDELSTERIEVDMLEFSGPAMAGIDNRLMSLKLVQSNLTNAIMFAPDGQILQPSESLYKKPILIERGSFRPVTHVNLDMIRGAREQFLNEEGVRDKDPVILFEITLHNLMSSGTVDDSDFLARADTLSALGYTVLISNYSEYYRLSSYFRRYSREKIGMIMSTITLLQLFNSKHYENLEGGVLEALGRLFSEGVGLFIYPMTREAYLKYLETTMPGQNGIDAGSLPELVTATDITVQPRFRHLYSYLLENGYLQPITTFDASHFSIFSRDVLNKLRSGDSSWEEAVPPAAAQLIKQRHMFGYKS